VIWQIALAILCLLGAWLAWVVASFVQIVLEAGPVDRALHDPNGIRWAWRDRPHLWFRVGQPRRLHGELRALGFELVGARDEVAGPVKIPMLVFVSPDRTVVATSWVWRWLALGQLRGHLTFWSRAGDTFYGTSQLGPHEGEGLVSQVAAGTAAEMLAAHRGLATGQLAEIPATREATEALAREIHARSVAWRNRPPPPPPQFVDGREVAARYLFEE
jgi:hypothetical protein